MSTTKGDPRAMERKISNILFMVIVVLLLLFNKVDGFAPRPALTPKIAGASRVTTPRWEKLHNAEAELVTDNSVGASLDNLKQMESEGVVEKPIEKNKHNPAPVVFKYLEKMSKKNGLVAATAALALTLFMTPAPSMAAMTGGRVGGRVPTYSSSRTVVTRSSYSPSYYSGGALGFSSGLSAGYYSRPSVMVNPMPIAPLVSSPYYPIVPTMPIAPTMPFAPTIAPFYSAPRPLGFYGAATPGIVINRAPTRTIFSLTSPGVISLY